MKMTTPRLLATLTTLTAVGGLLFAQRLPQPRPVLPTQPSVQAPTADDDTEVLARGPVHEAFASTAEVPTGGGAVIEKRPPDAVEELPPDQKPEGDNVQWIPGYWHWDDERKDFIWISGFWRAAPPGRVWVPGGWQEVRGGFQWVAGFWNVAAKDARQAELEYLPPPPVSLETGPTVLAPGDDYFYTPGCWTYRVNRYVWRPGFWVTHRPDWCWVPDHYRWTPCGYVFIPGFWDEPLERRGVLFAPVYFRPAVFHRPRFVYTPVYAVPAPCLHTSLFVRTGYSNYYFGDYFEQRYVTAGFNSWAGASFRGSNFAVSVGVGRGFAYDPLWNYYAQTYRREPAWQQNIASVYAGRYNGNVARPPRTLVQQNNTVVNNITNVTNNTNVIVNNTTNTINKTPAVAAVAPAMLTPLKDLKQASPTVALKTVQADDRVKEQKLARELRQVSTERRKAETQLVNAGAVVTKADDKPRQAKVDLPTTAVARAQIPATPEKAPPPAPTPVTKKPEPKPTPTTPGTPAAITAPPQPTPVKVDPKPVVKPDPTKVPPAVAPPVPAPVKVDPPKPGTVTPPPATVNPTPVVKPPVATPPAVVPPKPADPVKLPTPTPLPPQRGTKPDPKSPVAPPRIDPPKVTTPPTTPAPVVKPPEPAKVAPAPVVTPAPKPIVVPPPAPRIDPPKTVAQPPVKVDVPKPAAAIAPPKAEPAKSPPPTNFRSARPKEEKKDEKKK